MKTVRSGDVDPVWLISYVGTVFIVRRLTSKCYQGGYLEDDVRVGLLSAESCWDTVCSSQSGEEAALLSRFFLNKRMFWALREASVGKSTVALVEDQGSVPAPTWYLETACNSSSMGSHDLL